ncbi:Alpha/beta hydrolase family protein [compost metagenome]
MAKLDSKHNTVFFHMGPGFHSRIEAHQFSERHPHVLFLDQPTGMTFPQLVDWACQSIREQSQISGKPLRLLGHSFGGQIIAAALPQIGHLVSEVRLLNSAYDTFDCFGNIHQVLAPQNSQALSFWKTQSPEAKLNLIFEVAQHPQFNNVYWMNEAAQEGYTKIASLYSPLNIEAFVHVFSGVLQTPPLAGITPWSGKAEIYYSLTDNLIRSFDVVAPWQEVFRDGKLIEIPNIGHHGLFESPRLAEAFFRD